MRSKIDKTYIIWLIVLTISSIVIYCFRDSFFLCLGYVLCWPHLSFFSGGFSTVVSILHKIKMKKLNFKLSMSFNEFNIPFSELFSFALNPVTVVCSLSLAKALYLQYTNKQIYFQAFSSVEMVFVGIVTAYLLYSSLTELYKDFIELVSKPDIDTPIAIENNTTVTPQPEQNP